MTTRFPSSPSVASIQRDRSLPRPTERRATPNAKPKRKKPGSMRSYASLMSMSHSNT